MRPQDLARDRGGGNLALVEQDLTEERVAIECKRDGPPHPHVFESRAVEIEADRHDAVRSAGMVRRLPHTEARIGLQAALVRAGNAPQEIYLPALQREDLRAGVGDDAHHDLVEVGQTALEVRGVSRETDLGALLVGDELEGPGTDRAGVGRIRLRITALVKVLGDDRRFGGVELLQQGRIRLLEAEDDRTVVGGLDAGQRAAHRRLGARVELEQHLIEAELDVGCREASAVVPGDTVAQAEAVDRARLLDDPALGQIRHWVPTLVAPEQTVVDELGCRVSGAARRDGRIQMTGIRGDRDDQCPAGGRVCLRVPTGGRRQRGDGEEREPAEDASALSRYHRSLGVRVSPV